MPDPEPRIVTPRRVVARRYAPSDPLLNSREAALERGQGLSSFWRDVKRGRVPKPFYVSPRAPRWRLSEIIASVEACRVPEKGDAQ